MAHRQQKTPNLTFNFLPYITCSNPKLKTTLKLLLDTGANKNILKPGIIPKPKTTTNTRIKNITGIHSINKKGKINLLGHNLPPQTYYEINFHDFFDGILGSEYLAKTKSKINYNENCITIGDTTIPFDKYYPSSKTVHHTVTIDTENNGDWFVPDYKTLYKGIIIEPGIYSSRNNKSTIKVITSKQEKPNIPYKFGLNVNNFETITPIPIEPKDKISREVLNGIIRTNHLSEIEKEQLFQTILENQSVLLKPNEKLTTTSIIKHKIITTDDQPVYTKSYRYPHAFKNDVEQQIRELLDNGIIRHSTSPYSSPIWVVPKKLDASGKRKIRVVIDYRKINDKTVSDKFPIPQIDEILDNLGKSIYFTTLDLKSGFHQIEMDPEHQSKTAFSTALGHFQFTRMPFGLKNAPATFQRAMNSILSDYIGTICFVYLDDIIIIGKSLKEHILNLAKVLKRLAEFNLKIQLDKCEFMKRETEFLGHVITQEGIKADPEKITKILNWKLPENPKEIKQFLGLCGYYRRFIKDYAKIVKPMTKFLKKDEKVDKNDESFKAAFIELKNIISSDQILAYPDFSIPFILTTDASNYALGAVLSQIQNSVEKPIAFASRTLQKTEINYSTTEKEALAIIWAVGKFNPYLYGRKFTLITDHKPLLFIKNAKNNAKILRWRLDLETYDYDIKYKEGRANVVADALSRITMENNSHETENNTTSSFISGTNNNQNGNEQQEDDAQTIHSADDSGDYYIHFVERPINYYRNQLIFKISTFSTTIRETLFQNFKRIIVTQPKFTKDDITNFLKIYHNGKQTALLAPETLVQIIQEAFKENFGQKGHFVFASGMVEDVQNEDRQNLIIQKEHDRAHRGANEVEAQIKRAYFFPNIQKKIREFINTCTICNQHKYERKPYNIKLSPRPITNRPMERVHMDIYIINKLSFLSLVDAFSKHLQMVYLRTKNLTNVQKALSKYFSNFGVPQEIITDHETTFRSIQLKNFLDQLGTQLHFAASSESNGQIERTHSTITEIFNSNKHKFPGMHTKSILKLSVALYNDSVHSATKYKPNEILFNQNNVQDPEQIVGKAQEIFLSAIKNLGKASANQTKQNDNREEPPVLQVDQEVFVIPNVRKKTEPRAKPTKAHDVQCKTFKNSNNVKRHKSKIKRLKRIGI